MALHVSSSMSCRFLECWSSDAPWRPRCAKRAYSPSALASLDPASRAPLLRMGDPTITLGGRFRYIFYFFLLGGGEGGVRGARKGRGSVFY